jgi:hypothetical protein
MNYSSFHKVFASLLNDDYFIDEQDVLENPEKYLGPNYKEVLNRWFYCESLYYKQWIKYNNRYLKLHIQTRGAARELAKKLALEVIDPRFVDYIGSEEWEIIAAHLYLQRNIPFTFLPLIFDL